MLSQNLSEFVDIIKNNILTKLSIGFIADHLSFVKWNISAEKVFGLNTHFNNTSSMNFFYNFIIVKHKI